VRERLRRRRSQVVGTGALALAAMALALVGAPTANASSCTLYASPTGDDAAPGSADAPMRTVQHLVDSLQAGDTGCLRGGRYDEPSLRFSHGGTSTARLTLRSYPGERATIGADYVYLASTAPDVTISGVTIEGRPYAAPTVQVMAADAVLEDSTVTNHNLAESCVILGNLHGYGAAERPIIRRNRLHDCGNPLDGLHDHAIYVESTTDASITDNVIWHAAAYGIQLYPDAQRTRA
jgi:hypothetical protein